MHMGNFTTARQDAIPICPSCGGSDYENNRIDERLYVELAREAPRLRYEGNTDEAVNVLSALYAIKICNFILPHWRCACGVAFDD